MDKEIAGNIFFRCWNPPTAPPPPPPVSLQSHLCSQSLHNRKLQPLCAGGCVIFITRSVFSQRCACSAREFLQYYLSSPSPTVQPSKTQERISINTDRKVILLHQTARHRDIKFTFLALMVQLEEAMCCEMPAQSRCFTL